jgi:hypothetical protein
MTYSNKGFKKAAQKGWEFELAPYIGELETERASLLRSYNRMKNKERKDAFAGRMMATEALLGVAYALRDGFKVSYDRS